ncbi:hypothetical protein N2600_01770 [Rhizobium sp. WSM1274]|uniref:hypothetical protein n=1 Tax=Rhizobium sp. WSM1274 TaxID=3138254 RepID=UPI0021A6A46F|nr:hypothetical protein [Rhizobium leguminosarum]UWU28732.1 hypothetical protein N2600_01770 [Rhizobium leguminosarum bv. viciae]
MLNIFLGILFSLKTKRFPQAKVGIFPQKQRLIKRTGFKQASNANVAGAGIAPSDRSARFAADGLSVPRLSTPEHFLHGVGF